MNYFAERVKDMKKSWELAKVSRQNENKQNKQLDSIKITSIQEKKFEYEHLLKNLPRCYHQKTFNDFNVKFKEQQRVKAIVERYVKTATECLGTSLIFGGYSGTGKTFLASIMAQSLFKTEFTIHYEPNLLFLRKMRDEKFKSYQSFESLLNFYSNQDFLIIDEITESVSGNQLVNWEKNELLTVIDRRYQDGRKSTVVITNKPIHEFKEILGESITGRLLQKGILLAFDWKPYRSTTPG